MKFVANIEVIHRDCCCPAASYSRMAKRRYPLSSITFGRKWENPCMLILVHQSCQDRAGTVYRVDGNIDMVIDKYVQVGKMTVCFKEPSHDLIINGEASTLKKFNLLVKLVLQDDMIAGCKLSAVKSDRLKKILLKPKHLSTNSVKYVYPVLEDFSKSTVRIKISGFQKKSFDMRLLGFPQLKVLDLSDNQLTEIPAEIDLLQSLQVLSLANNHLGAGKKTAWTWLCGERLSRQLQELDLSDNELTFLHPFVFHLRALRSLRINNNGLRLLSGAIGTLNRLKYLDISDNILRFMPGSIFLLKLQLLDVSDNLLFHCSRRKLFVSDFIFPSLMELAARCVVNNRLRFGLEDVPVEVQRYLDTVSFCHCGKASYESGPHNFCKMSSNIIADVEYRDSFNTGEYPVQFRLCSIPCMVKFNNFPLRVSLERVLGE